jgi:hypothetical protein
MAKRYSDAVRKLAADTSALGEPVSPRELERWNQAGLLPPAERTYPGRGSTASYPDAAAGQAAEVASLLNKGWRLDEVAVPLFLNGGFEVTEDTVKRAFKAHAEHGRHLLTRRASDQDTLTIAEAATKTLMRAVRGDPHIAQWRERLKGREDSPGSILESAVMNMVHVLLSGEPISQEGLSELYTASGIEAMVSGMSQVLGEDVSLDEFNELLTKLDLVEYSRLVDDFTLEELIEARAVLHELAAAAVPMLRIVGSTMDLVIPEDVLPLIAEAGDTLTLFGLPLAAWALRRNAAGAAEVLEALRANALTLEASSYLLDHFPREYWRFLGPQGAAELEAAADHDRREVFHLTQQAFEQDARLINLHERLNDEIASRAEVLP